MLHTHNFAAGSHERLEFFLRGRLKPAMLPVPQPHRLAQIRLRPGDAQLFFEVRLSLVVVPEAARVAVSLGDLPRQIVNKLRGNFAGLRAIVAKLDSRFRERLLEIPQADQHACHQHQQTDGDKQAVLAMESQIVHVRLRSENRKPIHSKVESEQKIRPGATALPAD